MIDTVDRWLDWFQAQLPWMPPWAISAGLLALAVMVARGVHQILFRAATRIVAGKDLFWRSLVSRTHGPTRLAAMIVAISAAATVAPLSDAQVGIVRHILLLAFIALLGWVALTALHIWMTVYLRRFTLDAEDNLLARKHVTQTRILRRVVAALIVTVALSAALMTFEEVRQYGISLLASAGAAGLVIGLALQPMLKNMIAGIQLAVTQPIRIDDAVLVENEWGNIEEITSTYVVVRLWDWRRLVLPLSYFIEHPFQNWTREGSALIGSVFLYLDHTAPVAEMRCRLDEIAKASPLWDGQVAVLQVTDFREQVMEIRMLVSARNSGRAFDLRCEVREKMIGWLQEAHPRALPRWRGELQPPDVEAEEIVRRRAAGRG
ncbi:mechanosensitive ion channel family protein [Inquilinus sp. NPDC058860]|uniref:mechanosensitive ion channel family protein n=1 Tax=Inquilinus sp. NPDC058860 TaxID=3346652 RepID=UPI0036CFDA2E